MYFYTVEMIGTNYDQYEVVRSARGTNSRVRRFFCFGLRERAQLPGVDVSA
jgi:hypothetical protein